MTEAKDLANVSADRLTKPALLAAGTAASSADPRAGLRAVVALRKLLETLESLQVRNARKLGWSWQEIAEVLQVSKQAVHKKHAGRET